MEKDEQDFRNHVQKYLDTLQAYAERGCNCSDVGELRDRRYASERLLVAFEHWYGPQHPHSVRLQGIVSDMEEFANEVDDSFESEVDMRRATVDLTAFLEAHIADLEDGWAIDYAARQRIATYNDLLDLAGEMAERSEPEAWGAAVLTGAVLERHLGTLAGARGLDTQDDKGRQKGLSALNNALKAAGVYKRRQATEVLAWTQLRNAAVHNNEAEFEPEKVPDMIERIRLFMENHPE